MAKIMVPKPSFITIDDLNLHYLDWGNEGKPVVLILHGLTGNAYDMTYMANHLKDRYHFIALTNRGHGDSQHTDANRYTYQDFAIEIAQFIDSLNIKKLSILGSSLGGMNGIFYAATHPERVTKLIVSDVPPEFNAEWMHKWRLILAGVKSEFSSFTEFFELMRQTRDPLATEEKVRGYAAYSMKELPGGRLTWKHDVEMEKSFYKIFIKESQAILLGRKPEIDWWYLISQIRCPTLLLRGTESNILDHETIHRMAAVMLEADIVEVEGSGHVLFWDKPDEFNQIVEEFLARKY